MSVQSISSIQSPALGLRRAALSSGASFIFMVLAAVLATSVFVTPISDAWKRSTFEQFENTDVMLTSVESGSLQRQIALLTLGLFGVAAWAWSDRRSLRVDAKLGALFIAYMAWCAASFLWSEDLSMSLKRLISLGCEVVAALAIAKHASPRQFVWLVFACTLAWLGLGMTAELSLGTFRPWEQGYRFAGIFHPNEMGAICALLLMSSLYLAIGQTRVHRWLYPVVAAAFAFLVLTESRSALGAAIVAIAGCWVAAGQASRVVRFASAVALALACATVVVSLGVVDVSADTLAMGRKDHEMSSLTGRLPLWNELLDNYVSQNPLAGHGYAAFWTADHIDDVSKTQLWPVASSHSTYIDLLLNVGWIGLLLCLAAMVLAYVKSCRLETQHAKYGYGFIAMLLAFVLANGLLETTIGVTTFLSFFSVCGVCYVLFHDEQALHPVS